MKVEEYAQLAEYEHTYWWHVGRLSIIETYLRRFADDRGPLRILNVGCGTGGTVALLERFGHVDNVDVSEDAIAFMQRAGYPNTRHVDGTDLPHANESYDLVVALDVLEHIPDDVSALREWSRVIHDRGGVLLTVPAYQWLWSNHDVTVHHVRRHTLRSIRARACAAHLNPVAQSYAFLFSLPLVVGFRVTDRVFRRASSSYVKVPVRVNAAFVKILKFEAFLLNFVSFPAGTSVITLLEKGEAALPV